MCCNLCSVAMDLKERRTTKESVYGQKMGSLCCVLPTEKQARAVCIFVWWVHPIVVREDDEMTIVMMTMDDHYTHIYTEALHVYTHLKDHINRMNRRSLEK